jgi:peroxiredoxin
MACSRQSMMMGIGAIVALVSLGSSQLRAQASDSLAGIDAAYAKELRGVEEARIKRLDALSQKQKGAEATATLEALFRAAISAQLFEAAEPAAERILKKAGDDPLVDYLAASVNVLAEADRNEFEQSYQSLLAGLAARSKAIGAGESPDQVLPAAARLTLLETYYQRLAQAGQFVILRKALVAVEATAKKAGETTIEAFVADRIRQIDLIGKPAPDFKGIDQDGKEISLSKDLKGNVVLLVFWASWCLPCAEQAGWLGDLHDQYVDKGLRIVGVNLDLHQEGAGDAKSYEPVLRHFLLEHNVRWPSIIDQPGPESVAGLYNVTEIPASVLIGADGAVVHLDLNRSNAVAAIEQALRAAGKLPK